MNGSKPCPHKDTCALFPLFQIRTALHYWIDAYCEGEPAGCHRLQSMRAGQPPSACLLPNGRYLKAPIPAALAS